MLNFSRNGTRASAGVSQMTMPSRYRSLIAVPAAADDVWATTPSPSAAGGAVGTGAADCPEADTVQNRTDTNAAATLTSFKSTPGDLASHRRGNKGSSSSSPPASRDEEPLPSAEHDREGEPGFARFLVLAVHVPGSLGQGHNRGIEIDTVPGRDLVAGNDVGRPCLD